jgi:hypothetical protein
MIRRHVTNCDRLTGKPEVIPETESLHHPPKVQGWSRRRILSTHTLNFLIGVRKVCATGLHETTPNCTTLAAASNASCRKCWSTRTCKSAASHSKSADLRVLGVRLPLPAPTKQTVNERSVLLQLHHFRADCDFVVTSLKGKSPCAAEFAVPFLPPQPLDRGHWKYCSDRKCRA